MLRCCGPQNTTVNCRIIAHAKVLEKQAFLQTGIAREKRKIGPKKLTTENRVGTQSANWVVDNEVHRKRDQKWSRVNEGLIDKVKVRPN